MGELKKYLLDHKFNSIFIKNLTKILIVLIIPIMIVSLTIIVVIEVWQRDRIVMEADNKISKIALEMEQMWTRRVNSSFTLCYDSSVTNFYKYANEPLTQKKIDVLRKLQVRLLYSNSANDIANDTIMLFSRQTQYIVTPQTAMTMLEMENIDTKYYNNIYYRLKNLTANADRYVKIDYNSKYITFYCSSEKLDNNIVYAFSIVEKDNVASWLKTKMDYSNEIVFLLDESGNYITGNIGIKPDLRNWNPSDYVDKHEVMFTTINHSDYMAVAYHSAAQNWDYVLLYPTSDYSMTRNMILLLTIIVLMLLLGFGIFSSWRVSIAFYRPIQIIIDLLQSPQMGTIEYYRQYCHKYDEMNMISTLIQQSYFQNLSISKELEERKKLLQRAQNYALAAQINPHFIFNTLEIINWKVLNILKGENEISTAMSDFSQLMRYSLNNKGLVRIIDEIDHARIYIRLRNSRNSFRFTTLWDIDESILNAITPFLVIQPLVENAITHGIRDIGDQGQIVVHCYGKGDSVIIEVKDNGVGFAPALLQDLEKRLQEEEFEGSLHIGLANTHHRIRLTYGDAWGLKICSKPGETIVAIYIPKIFNMKDISSM